MPINTSIYAIKCNNCMPGCSLLLLNLLGNTTSSIPVTRLLRRNLKHEKCLFSTFSLKRNRGAWRKAHNLSHSSRKCIGGVSSIKYNGIMLKTGSTIRRVINTIQRARLIWRENDYGTIALTKKENKYTTF